MLIRTIGKEELKLIKENIEYTSVKIEKGLTEKDISDEAILNKTIYLGYTYQYLAFDYSKFLPNIILIDNLNIALLKPIFILLDSVFRNQQQLNIYIYFNSKEGN